MFCLCSLHTTDSSRNDPGKNIKYMLFCNFKIQLHHSLLINGRNYQNHDIYDQLCKDIFTMISLGTRPSEITHQFHVVISLYCSNSLPLQLQQLAKLFNFLRFFTATFLWCTLLNRVRVAAKISAGGVGSPYSQLYL